MAFIFIPRCRTHPPIAAYAMTWLRGVFDDLLDEACRQLEGHGLKVRQAQASSSKSSNTPLNQIIAQAAMGGWVRHRGIKIKATKDHEIKADFQSFFQLLIRQAVPLAKQKVFEKHDGIIVGWAQFRALQPPA